MSSSALLFLFSSTSSQIRVQPTSLPSAISSRFISTPLLHRSPFRFPARSFTMTIQMPALLETSPTEFSFGSISKPTPSPSQVLITVHAASLNPIDYKRGAMNQSGTYPMVAGYDVAGVVEAVGADVTRWKKGDRVYGDIMEDSVGVKDSGTIAKWCVCNENVLGRIPSNISYVEAAAMPVAGFTTIQAFDMVGLKEGQNVLITGGAGGVGVHAIQIAKNYYKAGSIATTASGPKIEFVKSLGADIVVDYKNEDAGEKLENWADVILDTTSEGEMEKKIIKKGGHLLSIAQFGMDGVVPVMLKPTAVLAEKMAKMLEDGSCIAIIDKVYTLDESMKAMEHLKGGRAKGKVIVQVISEGEN